MTNKIKDTLKNHKYLLLSFFLPLLILEGIAIAEKIPVSYTHLSDGLKINISCKTKKLREKREKLCYLILQNLSEQCF